MKTFVFCRFLFIVLLAAECSSCSKSESPFVQPGAEIPVVAECGTSGSRPNLSGGPYNKTLDYGGRTRNYIVHLPEGYDSALRKYPVILLIHGRGGTAASFLNQTRMAAFATPKNYIVVTPEGTESTLLPGQTVPGLVFNAEFNKAAVADKTVDDVGFLTELLNKAQDDYAVDCSRIFAAGFSMGAMMTYKLASAIPERLAGIGIVAGTIGSTSSTVDSSLNAFQNPSNLISLPLIAFHSTDDNAVWYDGCTLPGHNYIPVIDSATCSNNLSSINYYQQTLNECASSTVGIVSGTVTQYSYKDCRKASSNGLIEAKVEFYKLTSGSHRWPGGSDLSANQDVDATLKILEFFDSVYR